MVRQKLGVPAAMLRLMSCTSSFAPARSVLGQECRMPFKCNIGSVLVPGCVDDHSCTIKLKQSGAKGAMMHTVVSVSVLMP